jgi:hypothetical protein
MRFRVTAIQDTGLPQGFADARLWLEDWLNGAVGDGDFGWPEGCIVIVIFATSCLPKKPAVSRLVSNGGTGPMLALHVVIDPEALTEAEASNYLALLCKEIVRCLPAEPVRKPKRLDYELLRNGLVTCIEPYATSAV